MITVSLGWGAVAKFGLSDVESPNSVAYNFVIQISL